MSLKLGNGLNHIEINENEYYGWSRVFTRKLLLFIISKKGLSGFEFASGIPGSVGGAVYMNAGAHGSDIIKNFNKGTYSF